MRPCPRRSRSTNKARTETVRALFPYGDCRRFRFAGIAEGTKLASSNRLLKSADFRQAYKKGRSYSTPLMVAYVRSNDEAAGHTRFGVVASGKVGGAVKRNRARRQIREALRLMNNLACNRSVDVVVVVRKSCTTADYTDIAGSLGYLMRRSGLLEGDHDA